MERRRIALTEKSDMLGDILSEFCGAECSRQLQLVVGFGGALWIWVAFCEYQCEVEHRSMGVSLRVRVRNIAIEGFAPWRYPTGLDLSW